MRAILRVLSKACGWIKTEYDKYFVRLSIFIIPALVVLLVVKSVEVHNIKYELSTAQASVANTQPVLQKPTIITNTTTKYRTVIRVVHRTRVVHIYPVVVDYSLATVQKLSSTWSADHKTNLDINKIEIKRDHKGNITNRDEVAKALTVTVKQMQDHSDELEDELNAYKNSSVSIGTNPVTTSTKHTMNIPCKLFNTPMAITNHTDAINAVGHLCYNK